MEPCNNFFAPYIGITDFMTREQSLAMLSSFERLTGGNIPHKLMIGVMMSYKTSNGIETKWTKAFPSNDQISDIFVKHPLAFNTLHYADYTNTDVTISLSKAIYYGGVNLDALQLDMVWPHPQDIKDTFEIFVDDKRVPVILQIGKTAMEQANNSVSNVISRLLKYDDMGVIEGVLFDKSMGQGKTMNAEVLLPYVEAVNDFIPNLYIAVAGGLSASTLSTVEPLVSRFPNISIDAQGRLRPSGSALDPIDWSMAEEYLTSAVNLFKKYHQK